jgi:orotate phosphoribosyltransferase-like protein
MIYEERKQRAKEIQNEGYQDKEGAKRLGISKDTFRWFADMK